MSRGSYNYQTEPFVFIAVNAKCDLINWGGIMRRIIFIAEMVLCMMSLYCILVTTEVRAYGLGVYGSYGYGSADWPKEGDSRPDKDDNHYSVGLVFDTAVAKDKLFNYRLNIGYEKLTAKPGEGMISYDLNGVVIDNDFGFGLIRNERIRFWAGPEVRLQYLSGRATIGGIDLWNINLFGVGIGPVIGLNYNFGSIVTLGLKGGYLYNYYTGTGSSSDLYAKENLFFVNAAIIFRFDE